MVQKTNTKEEFMNKKSSTGGEKSHRNQTKVTNILHCEGLYKAQHSNS